VLDRRSSRDRRLGQRLVAWRRLADVAVVVELVDPLAEAVPFDVEVRQDPIESWREPPRACPSNLRRSFSTLTTDTGLGHWHPHELRHSAASIMSAAGVPLEQIADTLGHDGTRMTALVYRHAITPTITAPQVMDTILGTKPEPMDPARDTLLS